MKNVWKFGVLALALVFGFALIGCGDSGNGSGEGPTGDPELPGGGYIPNQPPPSIPADQYEWWTVRPIYGANGYEASTTSLLLNFKSTNTSLSYGELEVRDGSGTLRVIPFSRQAGPFAVSIDPVDSELSTGIVYVSAKLPGLDPEPKAVGVIGADSYRVATNASLHTVTSVNGGGSLSEPWTKPTTSIRVRIAKDTAFSGSFGSWTDPTYAPATFATSYTDDSLAMFMENDPPNIIIVPITAEIKSQGTPVRVTTPITGSWYFEYDVPITVARAGEIMVYVDDEFVTPNLAQNNGRTTGGAVNLGDTSTLQGLTLVHAFPVDVSAPKISPEGQPAPLKEVAMAWGPLGPNGAYQFESVYATLYNYVKTREVASSGQAPDGNMTYQWYLCDREGKAYAPITSSPGSGTESPGGTSASPSSLTNVRLPNLATAGLTYGAGSTPQPRRSDGDGRVETLEEWLNDGSRVPGDSFSIFVYCEITNTNANATGKKTATTRTNVAELKITI